ncbi:MAG: hemoglobin [Chitinophagaceae bacterium]|nr:hemoglobin [Chitinophagaceae bacterium]
MNDKQVSLIKNSWKTFRTMDPQIVGDLFYSKLFVDHPELRRMFPADVKQQHSKFVDMLSFIVSRLDEFEELTADIAAMAKRHVGYGVKTQHYPLVGKALFWTLKQGFGKSWTPELEEAWVTCYASISATMIKASA